VVGAEPDISLIRCHLHLLAVIHATLSFRRQGTRGDGTGTARAQTLRAARTDPFGHRRDHRKEGPALSTTTDAPRTPNDPSTNATTAPALTATSALAADASRRPVRFSAALSVGVGAAAVAAILAPALTGAGGTTWTSPSQATLAIEPTLTSAEDRAAAVSRSARSAERGTLPTGDVEPEVVGTRYATVDLNVRKTPTEDAKVIAVLDAGDKVRITDVKTDGFRQVLYKDKVRWVKAEYLSKSKPKPRPAGPSSAPCASGSGVESGLRANTIAVHRAVCNAFPSISSYGGLRGGGGYHGQGRALDIMVSGSTGDAVANYVRAHAAQLGVSEVIWAQRIWTVQRAGEGWRWMSDRGGATANHYDHVHVSTY
jgi:hypothetical protein